MRVQPRGRKPILIAGAIVVICLLLAGVAIAAGTSVSLKLKGEYARRHAVACHKHKDFRVFHRRATIEWEGFVTPAPAGHFPALLQVRRCVRGSWRDAATESTLGKKLTGKYKGFFSARGLAPRSHRRRAIIYYYARAIVLGTESRKVYFAVTN